MSSTSIRPARDEIPAGDEILMKIVLDIETVQPTREEWSRLIGKPTPGDQLSTDDCMDLFSASAADEQRRADDELYAKCAFDGTYSRIVCIGVIELSDSFGAPWLLCLVRRQ